MLKRFIKYYKPHRLLFFIDMIAALFVALIGLMYPVITNNMLNNWVPNENIRMIIFGGIILLVIYFIRAILRYVIQHFGHVMGVRMQKEMRSEMFDKLQKLPYTFFDNNETGKIMSRMTNDLWDISEVAHHGPENLFISVITLIGSIIYLFYLEWRLALILLCCIPIAYLITIKARTKMRIGMKKSREAMASINSQVESSITGVRVTRSFTNDLKEKEKFEKTNEEYLVARSKVFGAMAMFFASSQFVIDFFNVIVLTCGGIFMLKGIISFGDYSTFIVSVNMFINPINTLINFVEQFQSGSTGFKRFIEIIDEEEEKDKEDAIEFKRLDNSLSFNNVTFKYETSKTNVLDNISFNIEKGKTIALVGESGGGKTTICHLIPRFYLINDGSISIDNININDFKMASLRKSIGIVDQDVFLFNGSIYDNIVYGKLDAKMDEVIEAAKKANILDFIESLPDKWNSEVGERGVKLSGGQKQRIAIARAFLKNPPILILDEATSALDNTTELLIQESLNELSKGRTTIVVAHRLSTIRNADKILVISNGKLLESGSHEELMNNNGIYSELYKLQFRDTIEPLNIKLLH